MRPSALWLVVFMVMPVSFGLAAEKNRMVGKPVSWEMWGVPQAESEVQEAPIVPAIEGESLETPNQRRARLGLPMESTFPAEEYGEKIETPNQRRLRESLEASAPVPETQEGSLDEDAEERLASVR